AAPGPRGRLTERKVHHYHFGTAAGLDVKPRMVGESAQIQYKIARRRRAAPCAYTANEPARQFVGVYRVGGPRRRRTAEATDSITGGINRSGVAGAKLERIAAGYDNMRRPRRYPNERRHERAARKAESVVHSNGDASRRSERGENRLCLHGNDRSYRLPAE